MSLKNRYNILFLIVIALFAILVFRLAVMTIVEGDEYRTEADIKTIRDIPIKAPRGNIYDRNGVLLAGNIPSFTVQIRKDDIDSEDFDDTVFLLANILDRNNERIIDEFPIILNRITFKSELYQSEYYYIEELIEDLLIDNQLVEQIFVIDSQIDTLIDIQERILLILQNEVEGIDVSYIDGQYRFNEISREDVPETYLAQIIYNDSKLIKKLLANSELRKHIFDILVLNDLDEGVQFVPYSYTYDNDYEQIKKDLVPILETITYESDAKSDFLNLVRHYCSDSFYRLVFNDGDNIIMPGVVLYDRLISDYPDLPIDYRFDEVQNVIYFNFTNDEDKIAFINQHGYSEDTSAYNILLDLAIKSNVDFDVIQQDDVKFYAQSRLLSFINPMISVSAWEYTSVLRKNNWVKANLGANATSDMTAEAVFDTLKNRAELDDVNDYLARKFFVIKERYDKQGYLAYHPIDMCYGVTEKTVALLAENSDKLKGVEVVVQPLRYYPQNESAAHIIGYMGKISQDFEIAKYVQTEGYLQDDLIGKTGLEESFELLLSGIKGKETLKVDVYGNRISSLETAEPIPGSNLYLTVDIELQKKTEAFLSYTMEKIRVGGVYESKWGDYKFDRTYKNARSGAVVAIDVKTGELIAMVNDPSYDPNLFATGISQEDWITLSNESKDSMAPRPLYNISMLTAIQPGSTFKMVTALAALEKGVSPYERIYCAGYMEIGNQTFGCWIWNMYKSIHGYENMYEAIRDSCNFYFYTLVLGENRATNERISTRVELDDLLSMAKQLGLDDKTGIEIQIPNEFSGGVPSPETKISSIRFFLREYLNQNLDKFYAVGKNYNSDEKEQMINTIVSWVRGDDPLTRGEVYEYLTDMGLRPDKVDSRGIPLVDMIKYTYLNQAVWNDGDNVNISIGQGSNAYTPLQMANYIATIANGGYLRNVSVIKEGKTFDNASVVYEPLRTSERIKISDYSYLDTLTTGMEMVSADSKVFDDFPVRVASKTGTAQREGTNPETGELYDDFAWYIAYAPADDPQIAIAVVIFQGGSGRFPAPLVRDIIGEYLGLEPDIVEE
ncbi:MAG: penicillin-binding protein [Dethiosulfatibacter sp.]|nr:penicillin-binding protein [Dethiosulfatibacter sp.]